jgi:pyridinium-3,5-biscarboxylic acid mononucleotide sulfurtransferase
MHSPRWGLRDDALRGSPSNTHCLPEPQPFFRRREGSRARRCDCIWKTQARCLAPLEKTRGFGMTAPVNVRDGPPSPIRTRPRRRINIAKMPVAELTAKQAALQERLRGLGRTLIAYSGGVDSAFLAWAAHQALGADMLAVIADSASLARAQLADAVAFADEQGIPLEVISTSEMERPDYVRNDGSRCFHCKDELFTVMEELCSRRNFDSIAYGVNLDDQGDFRPGQAAASRHQIHAPLLEAGLTKQEIRELARQAGLRIWDKPAAACLSSRIEYGRAVTREALSVVEQGEDALHALGFRQLRVRHHGDIVRIEVAREELPRALTPEMAAEFSRIFKALGFKFVTLDLEGFRSGSMNSLLPVESLNRKP